MKTILWDNDGVLVLTEHLYFEASKDVLASVGVILLKQTFQIVSLKQGGSVMDLARLKKLKPEVVDELRQKRDDLYSEKIKSHARVRPGLPETLEALKGRVRMGIVTSSPRRHFDLIHRSTGLLPYFDFVLTREGFDRPKPTPDAYQTALNNWTLRKEDCLAIEDSERGVKSATRAGVTCLAFPHELSAVGKFSTAKRVVHTAPDLLAAIEDWL